VSESESQRKIEKVPMALPEGTEKAPKKSKGIISQLFEGLYLFSCIIIVSISSGWIR
jgi:hypothetical protein